MKLKIGKRKPETSTYRPGSVADKKNKAILAEKKKPKVDPARQRNLELVQHETGRLLAALDLKRKHGSVSGLSQVADVLRCCYTLIDMTEEMK